MIGNPKYLPMFVVMGIFKELDITWLREGYTFAEKRSFDF